MAMAKNAMDTKLPRKLKQKRIDETKLCKI